VREGASEGAAREGQRGRGSEGGGRRGQSEGEAGRP
jgi:hypothetical protein